MMFLPLMRYGGEPLQDLPLPSLPPAIALAVINGTPSPGRCSRHLVSMKAGPLMAAIQAHGALQLGQSIKQIA